MNRRVFLTTVAGLPLAAAQNAPRTIGLQLYSLRRQAEADLPGTLKTIQSLGFHELEAGSFYGRTAAGFARLLAAHGLKVTTMGAEWDSLAKSTSAVAADAHALGATSITCTSIPRRKKLTVADVTQASDNFNRWGEQLSRAGLRFVYHPHGPEFVPGPDGTLFDTMAKRMDPKYANFEMDVFWFVFGNVDPVKALDRYPARFLLMHVKDIRKGEPRTFDPGTVEEEASVPLGKGEVDWPAVLAAAQRAGVKHYYIEEEHPDAVNQIRQSLAYLKKLNF